LTVARGDDRLRLGGIMKIHRLLLPIAVLFTASACTHSGLDQPAATGDTAPGGDDDDGGGGNCPWVGTWNLTKVQCGSFLYDAWFEDHDTASLDVTDHPDGGCAVVATVSGESCERTEDWTFAVPVGGNVEVVFDGITDCNPADCQFSGSEDPCAEGNLGGRTETLSIDDTTGELVAIGLLLDTVPSCQPPLEVQTNWAKNR
jgi:hypothetical protein